MKNSEKKQELKNMVADLCAADAIETLEKNGCKIVVEKAHKVCYFGGERIGQIDSWYKKATRENADGETKQPRQPKKATRKSRKVTAAARPFNSLVLSFCRREFIDRETADNIDRARAAVTELTAALRSGLYNAARAYIVPALTAARADYNRAAAAADLLDRAAETAARFDCWQSHTAETETAAAAYKIQADTLAAITDEATRSIVINNLKDAGNYLDAPAPFARPVCEGLQAVTAADLVTAETAATFAAADRERAAADLSATLADAVYCDNLAARLECHPADLATLFNATAAPTVAETAAEVATVTKTARKGRAKKTA